MGNRIKKYMSLYVEVADSKHLPSGWSINTELRMEVVNHDLYKPSQQKCEFFYCTGQKSVDFYDSVSVFLFIIV